MSDTKATAEAIADALMTNGFGDVADRLVMVGPLAGVPDRDLGGWSRRAVIAQVVKVLEARDGQ
jgi:hypothetical protein